MRVIHRCLLVVMLLVALAPSAAADEGTPYQETIMVGPYPVDVWVSSWPIAAERSIDVTFLPAGGIADKSGTIEFIQPDGESFRGERALPRHPRNRDLWGIDLIALPSPGDWTIALTITGPNGTGSGTFGPFTLLEQPGPSPLFSWTIGVLPPVLLLAGLMFAAWRVVPRGTRRLAWSWEPPRSLDGGQSGQHSPAGRGTACPR